MTVTPWLYERCQQYREERGLPWFTAAWDLNVIIAKGDEVGVWGSRLIVCWLDDAGRKCALSTITSTGAWKGEWDDPTHPQGCLWTLPGHYTQALQLGLFKGRPALRQVASYRYVRWPPGQGIPTVQQLTERAQGAEFTAIRGTHCHPRVSYRAPAELGRDDSEGCDVWLYQHEAHAVIELVENQKAAGHGDKVSPTHCMLTDLGLQPVDVHQ